MALNISTFAHNHIFDILARPQMHMKKNIPVVFCSYVNASGQESKVKICILSETY